MGCGHTTFTYTGINYTIFGVVATTASGERLQKELSNFSTSRHMTDYPPPKKKKKKKKKRKKAVKILRSRII